jgi:hypothetical protein
MTSIVKKEREPMRRGKREGKIKGMVPRAPFFQSAHRNFWHHAQHGWHHAPANATETLGADNTDCLDER